MFHKAVDLEFKEGTMLQMTFQDGKVKQYDMSLLFDKYPQLSALYDRNLFVSGKLMGAYGIYWNDDLDLEAETIYEEGKTVNTLKPAENVTLGNALAAVRARKGISQKKLSAMSGIDQSDLSKIERGFANPSINTLKRIAKALDTELIVDFRD